MTGTSRHIQDSGNFKNSVIFMESFKYFSHNLWHRMKNREETCVWNISILSAIMTYKMRCSRFLVLIFAISFLALEDNSFNFSFKNHVVILQKIFSFVVIFKTSNCPCPTGTTNREQIKKTTKFYKGN